jgi:hypothetical protein
MMGFLILMLGGPGFGWWLIVAQVDEGVEDSGSLELSC